MLGCSSSREFIPEDGVVTGPARIAFSSPKGEISGPTTLRISPDGHVTIRVEVEDHSIPSEHHGFLMPFIQGIVPTRTGSGTTTFGSGGRQTIETLELKAKQGCFRASRALVSNSHFELFGSANARVEIVASDLEFVAEQNCSEDIWCMPLLGKLGEFRACADSCWIGNRGHYVHFEADGHSCGLQIFDPATDSTQSGCGALVFGVIGTRPHGSVDEVQELLPWGLMSALGFASGNDVASPWLELRSFDGGLKRRIHQRTGKKDLEDGFAAFSRFDSARPNSGIGEFLRCFFAMPQKDRRSLSPPINLICSGTPGNATVDESITDLVKALDAICKLHGFGRESLMRNLDTPNSKIVEEVMKEARDQLRRVRKQNKADGKVDQLAIIDKIISRQANVAGDELDFGITVAALLRKFELHDSAAMNAYYSQLPHQITWEGLLSSVRGEVIHSGAIRMNSRGELVAWFEFARHLHDICKRVILREIEYKGTYSPSNVAYSGQYEVERVTASTTTSQLGYSVPPVGI
jgi:hypothetical protein